MTINYENLTINFQYSITPILGPISVFTNIAVVNNIDKKITGGWLRDRV